MWTWTSLVVLSLAVVSTLSFPRSDAGYNIPTVGLGSRAQYYVLHSDGTYKYGYDTGDGNYEQSMAQTPGNVAGAFGYKDPTGTNIKLEYTADDRGFIPRGTHLPVAPKDDFGSRVTGGSVAATRRVQSSFHPAAFTPGAAPASAVASVRSSPADPVEVAQVRSATSDDGSYSFSYETSSSSRSETGDAQNSVKGAYSFVADDGVNRHIQYISGADTGYIAEGDSLPVGPPVPGAESGIPTGRILPVLSEEEANALAASTSRRGFTAAASPVVATYSAPTSSASAPSPATRSKISPGAPASDASYSFSYDAGDSSRSESADPSLNVQGTYSFVPPDTQHRLTVNYRAGADTGFVAEGDHLPVAPDAAVGSRGTGGAVAATRTIPTSYIPVSPTRANGVASVRSSSTLPVEVAQVRSSAADDGSYSFAYETSSSSRSETGDAQNSVKGAYSFVADDGINRKIQYTAGADTGYIAEGDSLPVGPPVPGAESGIPTGRILPVLSEEEANALAASTPRRGFTDAASPVVATYSAPTSSASAPSPATRSKISPVAPASDASYSFSYDAGDSSRSESADPSLNVQGTYSFVPPDTQHRLTVNYRAGADTGFVAKGDHLPVAPEADVGSHVTGGAVADTRTIPASYTPSASAPGAAPASGRAAARGVASVRSSSAVPVEAAQVRSAAADDGSYSFSYETSSSSRSETGDAQNSVKGAYSFVADDGVNRHIQYIAGADTGYIAEGDSLPVGPPVPGAESGIPTGRILPVLSEEEANALAASTSRRGFTAAASPVVATYSAPTSSASAPSPATRSKISPDAPASDASYSFRYDAGDSSRSESADPSLNVQGSYSFVPPDTQHRLTVNYRAGADTGFVAEGDHLPVAPEADVGSHVTGGAVAATRSAGAVSRGQVTPGFYNGQTKSAGDTFSGQAPADSSSGHTSQVVGDVLLHQYSATNSDKFGYVFTAVRR
ncbi:streptococcal hemagglutinin-like [Cherax quadricarinatus]